MKRIDNELLPRTACLERLIQEIEGQALAVPDHLDEPAVNPSLHLLNYHGKNLVGDGHASNRDVPESGQEFVMVWKEPENGAVCAQIASAEDLLVLKMIAEDIDCKEVAALGTVPIAAVVAALERAVAKGIVLAPQSRIRRNFHLPGIFAETAGHFLTSPSFTLQWHITQACDLHCRHCYDRSDRSTLTLEQALRILTDLEIFCRKKHVKGQVSFTGGNPLLHPDFPSLYLSAAERGFTLAIMGNPTSQNELANLVALEPPDFFQISLEGLPAYNDFIRGKGNFARVMDFLDLLRDLHVYAMVMLTLTKDNIRQVLPLGEQLQGKANIFHFSRLAQVGEGAVLELPVKEDYITFLNDYLTASENNPLLGLKDNFLNILLQARGAPPFGGCTGFGCGAAFNFLAVLPDGEVHACRKFPSPVGNIMTQSLEEIYDSEAARRYRSGCAACRSCSLRPVCGGCLASAYSHGLNIFEQKDPYCFLQAT